MTKLKKAYRTQYHRTFTPLGLVLIHSHLAFASFETCFNTGTRFDDPRQFCQRRFFEHQLGPIRRCEVILVAVASVLIGGIARGAGPQCAVVRERLPGDHQPFLGFFA